VIEYINCASVDKSVHILIVITIILFKFVFPVQAIPPFLTHFVCYINLSNYYNFYWVYCWRFDCGLLSAAPSVRYVVTRRVGETIRGGWADSCSSV